MPCFDFPKQRLPKSSITVWLPGEKKSQLLLRKLGKQVEKHLVLLSL